MNLEFTAGNGVFTLVVIPLLIFVARVLDVTLGTMRIVFVSRGLKFLAPFVGFFEVLIWLIAIREVMQNLNNVFCYIAYAAGFAMGNFIGIYLEKRLAVGMAMLRVVTSKDSTPLIEHLKRKGYGVTHVEAEGGKGKVHILFLILRRSDIEDVGECIKKYNPNAFYSIEDVREVKKGIFPSNKSRFHPVYIGPFKYFRKGK